MPPLTSFPIPTIDATALLSSVHASVLLTRGAEFMPGVLPPGVAFARASTATSVNAAGTVVPAAVDTPRWSYDPITHAMRGLLVEPAGTNLLVYSEQFSQAAWAKSNATITANTNAAPDGQMTADKLVPTTGFSQHRVEYNTTIAAGGTFTFSAYVKAAGYGYAWLRLGTGNSAIINLATGELSASATPTVVTAMANGWWRVAITGVAAGNDIVRINALTGNVAADFAGDGSSAILIWGAQLETGPVASSYIPTVAAPVTRAADAPTITPNLGVRGIRVTTEAGVTNLTDQAVTGAYWPALTLPARVQKLEVLS